MSRAINTITAATAADGATNLNIDSGTLFVDTTTNKVGIGTVSPTAQVTIGKVVDSATIPNTPANHSISLYPPTTTGFFGGGIGWSTGVNTAANICAVDDGGSGALGLVLSTGNNSAITERLRIDSSGNVGIGTTSPTIISSSSKVLDIVGNASGAVRFERTSSTNPSYGYLAALNGYVGLNVQSNSAFLIFTNDTERFRIDSIGNVGIGTPSPDALLHVVNNQNGTAAAPQFRISGAASVYEALHYLDATAYYIAQNSGSRELRVYSGTNATLGVKLTVGATSWASISDSRSKDIIEPITNSLDKIQNINPVIGKYKNDELNTRRSFVIGQDVQEVFPESISVDSEGYISVRYSDLIPLLIGGIKELKSENDSLKSRIEALESA